MRPVKKIMNDQELAYFKSYARKTFDLWDRDEDSKVGKRLAAMAGLNPGYDSGIDRILSHLQSAHDTAGPMTHDKHNGDCPLNDPETFANPATAGLPCTCSVLEKNENDPASNLSEP